MTDNRLNELLYNKCILERKSYNKSSKKDRKFYRRRILSLTRELFLSPDIGNNDVTDAFMNYVYYCVEHFKNIDTNDILQGEYNENVNGDDGDAEADDDEPDVESDMNEKDSAYNSVILRKITKPNTLDSFIIRNIIKKNEPDPLPLQKDINLKDPQLRVKGIGKKKNLMNTYEESENAEKKEDPLSEPEIS